MTADDDAFFGRAPKQPFCPAFCPLKNLDRLPQGTDLSCVNCGAEFPLGGTERVPGHCKYTVDLR